MILPIPQGVFCARTVDGQVCIVDTPLRKYMPKYIKPMSKRDKITCGCKTCLSAMLIQSDLNNIGYQNRQNFISYNLILHQLDFYKHLILI